MMNTETQTAAKLEGTCPACFRTMAINADGTVARHGWQEQGGRQVGHYNQAWHVGACYGAGRKPFEVSPEGTIGYVADVVFPGAIGAQNYQARLETRPALVLEFATRIYLNHEYVACPWAVRLQPGDLETTVGEYPRATRVPSYETAWTSKREEAARNLAAIMSLGADLCAKIETWAPAALVERSGPVVHFKAEGARSHYCAGFRGRGFAGAAHTSTDRAAVTCARCLKSLATTDAEIAKVEAEKVDAAALVTFLAARAKGATLAEIKKGLGWDAKRVNRALDRDDRKDRRIERSWDATPTRYTAKA